MITIWHRIELDTVDERPGDALDRSVPAPLYDPLWLLARQRQMGEWQGSDGGSVVDARLSTVVDPIVTMSSHGRSEDIRDLPIEPFVEAEPTPPGARLRIRAGLHLLVALDEANLDYREALLTAFPPPASTGDDEIYAALAGAHDGLAAFAAIRAGSLAATVGVSTADSEAFARVTADFAKWFALQAGVGIDTWDPETLEHRFELHTQRHALTANAYGGGRLDWDAFDLTSEQPQPTTATDPQSILPLPIEIPGMPVARYWELEDPTSEPAALAIGPGEAARAVLLEFSLRFASDWAIAPFTTRAGAITRVQRAIVVDTFGVATELRSATTARPDRSWSLWSLSGGDGDSAVLLLPFSIDALEGPALEEVAITRDEQANLVWAIERVVPAALDRGAPIRELPPLPEPSRGDAQLIYEPLPTLPIAHIPFAKRVIDKVTWLVRARPPSGVPAWQPRGALVNATPRIRDVDVPTEGVVLVRRAQLARDSAGNTIVWSGRARAPGITSPSMRIAFDDLRLADTI